MRQLLLSFLLLFIVHAFAQTKPFRFAFLSDTHIGSPNGGAEEDLRRTVADINNMNDIAFVVLTGDITELGKNEELALAKKFWIACMFITTSFPAITIQVGAKAVAWAFRKPLETINFTFNTTAFILLAVHPALMCA